MRLFGSECSSQGGRKSPRGAKIFPRGAAAPLLPEPMPQRSAIFTIFMKK